MVRGSPWACIRTTGRPVRAATSRPFGIVGEGGDVVDEAGAGSGGPAHHLGMAGVDRERDARAFGQRFDHRQHAPAFLVEADGLGARPGRFPADVEHVGALGLELEGVGDGGFRCEVAAAVGEAVGRDVDDAHDAGPVEGEPGDGGPRRLQALEQGLPAASGCT